MFDSPLLAGSHVFALLSVAMGGIILWQLLAYVRLRVALTAVSKIPGPPAQSLWSGNLAQFLARDGEAFQKHVALDYGPVSTLNGFLGEPVVYVSDPKALHTILIKEEHVFQESGDFIGLNNTVFGSCLLSTVGSHHGKQRKLLNPVFSVNHMRYMLPLFYEIGYKAREAIGARLSDGPKELDMLGWLARIALELIGQGTLGYSFDPLVTDRPDAYGEALKTLLPELDTMLVLRKLFSFSESLPIWMRRAFVKTFPPGTRIHSLAQIVSTLHSSATQIYADKKRGLEKGDAEMVNQVGKGKDLISILLRANAAADLKDRLPDEEVIAQMSMFIIAGLDTTSNALSRILTLLAEHPDYQQKLRQELLDARAAEGLPYDDLNRLPLLDAVIRETLRLHPPATILFRVATQDTVLPLSEPIRTTDGKVMNAIPVAKGSQYLVGFTGCNMSKAMWGEDVLEWKPERWLSPLPATVTESRIPGVYSNLMTFSGGKRACIGFKFSEMEMKVVLSVMLPSFTFQLSDKPIVWNVGGVWYPTVGRESNKPELPLKVGLYQRPAANRAS
ncbi:cytochrome P450 [Rhodofomes roseus]|uniref:Cytochrome P450 n=1 Tax=Rhodofomes roseus TaxID=34475 RepID=A0ABQ8K613_9APHY|nr:cytochrome P450 [Rhodofomes roseus]KAH9832025.1 cytochrome P450 [Rhodofomes roseus]